MNQLSRAPKREGKKCHFGSSCMEKYSTSLLQLESDLWESARGGRQGWRHGCLPPPRPLRLSPPRPSPAPLWPARAFFWLQRSVCGDLLNPPRGAGPKSPRLLLFPHHMDETIPSCSASPEGWKGSAGSWQLLTTGDRDAFRREEGRVVLDDTTSSQVLRADRFCFPDNFLLPRSFFSPVEHLQQGGTSSPGDQQPVPARGSGYMEGGAMRRGTSQIQLGSVGIAEEREAERRCGESCRATVLLQPTVPRVCPRHGGPASPVLGPFVEVGGEVMGATSQ